VKDNAPAARIVEAHSAPQLASVRQLFLEYSRSLEIDLCFQGFERELTELPGRYAPPTGRLLLALQGNEAAGCVALRSIDDGTCEMKRLYVGPAFKGQGIGRALAESALTAARRIGYKKMRLDTLASMKEAISLYQSLGFQRIDPYYDNPSDCAMFLELNL
jgi:ribosomal protein S18 acetylase RimI-like enzyme